MYLDALQQYSWPGNVRELQNSMERTYYASSNDVLTAEDFRYVMGGAFDTVHEQGRESRTANSSYSMLCKELVGVRKKQLKLLV